MNTQQHHPKTVPFSFGTFVPFSFGIDRSHGYDSTDGDLLGSIPARAGEPLFLLRASSPAGVYPRPRGGASASRKGVVSTLGLSPPARGSHRYGKKVSESDGSIPARAGEPCVCGKPQVKCKVYPRPRGGAIHICTWPTSCKGLSPPARGSPGRNHRKVSKQGSIPARAGEPT